MMKLRLGLALYLLLSVPLLLMQAACSGQSKKELEKPTEPASPPKPVTARFAFQRMYLQARGWAADAQPLRISDISLKEVASEAGKAAAWRATFVSAQLGKSRSYSYSVVESPGNAYEGVLPGREESWSGSSGQARPFLHQMLKVDSDAAYVAAANESKPYLKKNPSVPVHFLLEYTPRFPNPAWRVFWGETLGSSSYSVFVDGSTGRYLQTLH
jgi:hypothetical protein